MSDYDSREDTEIHIKQVRNNLAVIFHEIARRYEGHDASKLEEPEKATFDKVTPLLKELTYGSEEYMTTLATMQEALDHHYAYNRHHPEHFKGTLWLSPGKPDQHINAGMLGMTLVDLIEMFCDWCAATERHNNGDIGKSIDHNMKRFGFGETMASIMVNTAQTYSMGRCNCRAHRPVPTLPDTKPEG